MMNLNIKPIDEFSFSEVVDENVDFIPLFSEDDDPLQRKAEIPDVLPILPLRNMVLFPGVIIPISVSREKSYNLVKEAHRGNKLIGIVTQKDQKIEDPKIEDIYTIGTVAQIIKVMDMPDNSTSVVIQGRKRFQMVEVVETEPYFKATIRQLDELKPNKNEEFDAIIAALKEMSVKIIQLSANIAPEAAFAVKNIQNAPFLINFIANNLDIDIENKQAMLEIDDLHKRCFSLLEFVSQELKKLELKENIQSKVKSELDQQQKEYILQQQLKTIQNELGGSPYDRELDDIKVKAETKKWSKEVAEVFTKELEKIKRINPASPDYSIHVNYLQTLVELPWNEYTTDNFDLKHAQEVLDEDHFGLEKVKERILEYLAVLKLKGDLKSPILCLYGPPGVGKTSLGRSIAKALDRQYVRISLGGLHDEAEIRGHRKTYIGAMPGRIIQNIKKANSSNPVFILDEIDKVGNDFHGDPSFALLEVLDPEQNHSFYDNYLEVEFDLSKVMFIATANSLAELKPALRDRMELIDVDGYIVEEKIEIAKRHLIPKQLERHGVVDEKLIFNKDVIENVVVNYTHESGVRELDQKIAKIVRAIAKKIGINEKYNVELNNDDIKLILGAPEYFADSYEGNDNAGVVTGLAWTPAGGKILFIESSLSKGKGGLNMTGNLGNVMKESAVLAMEYLKAHASYLQIPYEVFDKWNLHIHIPEGAIPKDGPSAGIAILACLASIFTQRKVKKQVALTGEITLRGKVLPVGGITEKILAAKRANIKEIVLSKENKKDIEEIKPAYIKDLTFHYVDTMMDALDLVLLKQKVKNAIKLDEI